MGQCFSVKLKRLNVEITEILSTINNRNEWFSRLLMHCIVFSVMNLINVWYPKLDSYSKLIINMMVGYCFKFALIWWHACMQVHSTKSRLHELVFLISCWIDCFFLVFSHLVFEDPNPYGIFLVYFFIALFGNHNKFRLARYDNMLILGFRIYLMNMLYKLMFDLYKN